MAVTAALTNTQIPNNIDATQQEYIVDGIKLTFSGSYATKGDTLALGALLPANSVPNYVDIYEYPPTSASATGYRFIYAKGSTVNNGTVQVFQSAGSAAPDVELSATTYPAALTGTTYVYACVRITRGI